MRLSRSTTTQSIFKKPAWAPGESPLEWSVFMLHSLASRRYEMARAGAGNRRVILPNCRQGDIQKVDKMVRDLKVRSQVAIPGDVHVTVPGSRIAVIS
jgi:hypothetical protein